MNKTMLLKKKSPNAKLKKNNSEKKVTKIHLREIHFKLHVKDEQRHYWTCLRNKCSTSSPVLREICKTGLPFFSPQSLRVV